MSIAFNSCGARQFTPSCPVHLFAHVGRDTAGACASPTAGRPADRPSLENLATHDLPCPRNQ
ncbi:hypothetical protein AN993_19580 [Stenotrophomonas maltophilia]|nr:hypothetical protein AN993_19580 [Stenotrophomonas maltophilia]